MARVPASILIGVLALAALFPEECSAALPPGYDEELYCPPGHCLRPRKREPGFAGGRTSFNECLDLRESTDGSGQKTQKPAAWGKRLGDEARKKLIDAGMQQLRCDAMTTPDKAEPIAAASSADPVAQLGGTQSNASEAEACTSAKCFPCHSSEMHKDYCQATSNRREIRCRLGDSSAVTTKYQSCAFPDVLGMRSLLTFEMAATLLLVLSSYWMWRRRKALLLKHSAR